MGRAVTLGLVACAPLLVAGRPGWAIATLAVAAAAALGASALSLSRFEGGGARWLVGALVVGTLATAAQAVPLPVGVASWLASRSLDDAEASAELLGIAPPEWIALSFSPPATRAQIVSGLTLLCVALAALGEGAAGRARNVARAAAASGILVGATAVAHEVFDLEGVYGLIPLGSRPSMLSPLVNENHLAGFLAMIVPVQIGVVLEAESQTARVGWLAGTAFTSTLAVLVVSRGGLLSLAIGLVVLAVLIRRSGWRPAELHLGPGLVVATGATVVLGVGLAVYSIREALAADLARTNLDKLVLAARGLDLVLERPFVGIGRGAYSEALVGLYGSDLRIEYAENLPIQWIVDWGIVVGGGILGALGWAWLTATRTVSLPARAGALAAVASIAAHDLVDFALEELGIAIVAVALLAAACARPAAATAAPSDGMGDRTRAALRRAALGVSALTIVVALGLGSRIDAERVTTLQERLLDLAANDRRDEFASTVRDALREHPSEPVLPLIAGYEAALHEDASALRWLNRAMVLAPGWPGPHLLAARALAHRGALPQAWLEVREVERRVSDYFGRTEGCILLEAQGTAGDAIATFVDEPGGRVYLDRLAALCVDAPDSAVLALDEAIGSGDLPGPRLRAAERAIRAGQPEAALALLDTLPRESVRAALCRARALSAMERHEEAVDVLRSARATTDAERAEVLEATARTQVASGDAEGMRETVEVLRGAASASPARAGAALVLLGDLERQLGNVGRAMRAFEEANRMYPACEGLARVAEISEALGDLRRAYQAHQELCRRGSPPACVAAERLAHAPEHARGEP